MPNSNVIIPTLTLILFFCLSCNSVKQIPADYAGIQLIFGKGGGVTGQAIVYYLLENGMVFRSQGIAENPIEKYGKIPIADARSILDNYNTLNLRDIDFVHPGNIYHFIEWKKGTDSHKITWGDNSFEVDENAQLLYGILNHKIATIKNK